MMAFWVEGAVIAGLAVMAGALYLRQRRGSKHRFIDNYRFLPGLLVKFRKRHPQLNEAQVKEVQSALKQYFNAAVMAKGKFVSMPSQVTDDLWHEFILFTRQYDGFCAKAFGRFLHHVPAEAMSRPDMAQEGIKRVWRYCCEMEGIDPKAPQRLPLLFAIDDMLGIENGFKYALDCRYGSGYCATDIGCGSGDNGCGSGESFSCGGSSCGSCGGGGD